MRPEGGDGGGIAIVGMAALFPGAADLDGYWHNIAQGVDAVADVPPGRLDPVFFDHGSQSLDRFGCRRGGFVDGLATFDPTAFGMMPVSVAAAEPDQLIALSTAAAAIADAGGIQAIADPGRVGVVVGRGGYLTDGLGRLDQRLRTAEQLVRSLRQLVPGASEEELSAVRGEFQRQLGPYQADDAIGLVPNLVASRIANRFDFSGPAYTVDAACASSLIALDHAVRLLQAGDCDVVVAGGVHHCHDLTVWGVFSHLGALSPSGHSRPFSRAADGLLIGEGTGMAVLKRVADAEAAADRVYAVVKGVGVSSDGRQSTVMRPSVAGQVLAVRRAWEAAGLDPATVGLIEAHGTATPAGDEAELATLTEVFGPGTSGGGGGGLGLLPFGSVKSMIGHAMPAAGVAGLIKAALALHHQVLPPTLHCEEPHPAVAGTRFRPLAAARPWEATRSPRRAGVNSFGFGGVNAHAVLEEHRGGRRIRPTPRRPGPPPAARWAADDIESLVARLADPPGRQEPEGRIRLAVLDPTPSRLALAAKVAAGGRAWRGQMDVWFSPRPLLAGGGRLAFVFPGIEATPPPPAGDVAGPFSLVPPAAIDTAQLGQHGIAVFAHGRLLEGALAGMGVRPDVVAGHSIGEWNGMVTAGMVEAATAGPYLARLDPAAIGMAELVYAAAGCSAATAQAAIAGMDRVVVSHDNCPHQSVLCGTETVVARATARLMAGGVIVSELPFRSGFHSPMFLPRLRQARDALSVLPVSPGRLPLWSATTCEPYPDSPDAIRELAARHLIDPIRFRELTLELYRAGVRAFVQVGVGSLAAFVDDTLKEHDHLAVAASSARAGGVDQLRRVAAALWVEGAAVSFDISGSGPPEPGGALRAGPVGGNARLLTLGTPLVSLAALPPLGAAGPPPAVPESVAGQGPSSNGRGGQPVDLAGAERAPRHISVEAMPWLADHCLVRQRDQWPWPAERFPVVPLTTMIRWLVERGADTRPDRVVTRVEAIRATRWLAADPAVDVVVSAAAEGPDRVRVAIDGYCRATVVFGSPVPPPQVEWRPLPLEEPSAVDAEALYSSRWMFHGPGFRAVSEITGICQAGIRGRLVALDAPGSLLDGAGQLVGYWVMARTATDRIVLPTGVDSIELYTPEPPAGATVDCTVRITGIDETTVRADLDLTVGARPWARVVGWTEHRFETDDVLFDFLRFPEHFLASQVHAAGWTLAPERCRRKASRDLVMRQYLTVAEQEHFHTLSPLAERQWLLGRMAVKDAVRDWLWSHGEGPVFPAEIEVGNASNGQPFVRGSFDADLKVSLAHTRTQAVAMVAAGGDVGIDIEPVAARGPHFDQIALTAAEAALLPEVDRDGWLTRFWVAKEAAAKAAGTGLAGTPKAFEVVDISADALLVGDRWVDTETITDDQGGGVVVGWTRHADGWTRHADGLTADGLTADD